MAKIMPPLRGPTREDLDTAEAFVVPPDWPEKKFYTDEMRRDINRVARELFMKRETIQ